MQRPTKKIENEAARQHGVVAGIDEAGRGPLAGPVVVGAVIVNSNLKIKDIGIADSKLLTDKKRREIFEIIMQKFDWSVGVVSADLIDRHGITWAVSRGLEIAVKRLKTMPVHLLLDGRIKPPISLEISSREYIKGDTRVFSIAAASICAKVWRDTIMLRHAKQYPQYNFEKHKGYGTKAHYEALKKYGPCEIHRKCFDLHLG